MGRGEPSLHATAPQSSGAEITAAHLLSRPYGLQAVSRWGIVRHAQPNVGLCRFVGGLVL